MDRRLFLQSLSLSAAGALPTLGFVPGIAWAEAPEPPSADAGPASGSYANLLILIELKGANDGLNSVVPYADPLYRELRPRLALPREGLLQLSEREALHPALKPLLSLWERRELAIVQGLGYPQPNLSHFRSIEIWDTASKSDEYLDAGWLARTFAQHPTPPRFATDGVVVGSSDMGPLSGPGTRAIALADPAQFLRNAKLAEARADSRNAALRHLMATENDIVRAAAKLNANYPFKTEFGRSPFAGQIRTAAQLAASKAGLAVIRLSLGGFDTHANQLGTHANLLKELAEGIDTLRTALQEIGRWQSSLIATYAEFGRRPRENQSGGTDHGTANAHFIAGGRVKGGLYGPAPQLDRLDGSGNLGFAIDFRSLYATFIDRWWGGNAARVLGATFPRLDLLRA